MTDWSQEQKAAIDGRDVNLLVAAAAGSGKTAVLVERIKQLVLKDQIDIDRMLIVTFTNAAAGEMRQRISAAIQSELMNEGGNEEYLTKQLNKLNRSSISTLHAFCIEIVRRYFYLIDVDPNFKVVDSAEGELLKMEAVEEVFETYYEEADPIFLDLVEMFGDSKDDRSFKELVLNLYKFIQSQPYPWKWLRECADAFSIDDEAFEQSGWVQSLEREVRIQLLGARDLFQQALDISMLEEGPGNYGLALEDDLVLVDQLLDSLQEGLAVFLSHLQNIKHKTLKKIADPVREDLKELCKSLRDDGKKLITELRQNLGSREMDNYLKDIQALSPYMDALYNVVESFASKYQEKKKARSLVDFNDMEHDTLEILSNPEAAREYREKFEYIFVDEYQDSNLVQEQIIHFIKRDNNLFLVGDVKQSIYKFRLADPSLFMSKYEQFGLSDGAPNQKIDLIKNFRSRAEILNGANFIFKHIMSKDFGEMDYDDKVALYPGIKEQGMDYPEIELVLLEKKVNISESSELPELSESEEEGESLDETELEAVATAEQIRRLLNQEVYDAKTETSRKIEYRDIVILMRATRNRASVFVDTFATEGIPVYADVDTGYFEALEVGLFINLLRVIDNRRQDIPLLSVMRSPIFNFSIDELIELRVESPSVGLFDACEQYIASQNNELSHKLWAFTQKLSAWKEDASYLSMEELMAQIFKQTGYFDYVGAMPGGIQRQANLRLLFERARQFQASSMKGLFYFIKFVDKIQSSSSSDMGMARVLGENDNVVRIMSIHKSKGLEFPVVILVGMGKKFNQRDASGNMLIHKELGLGPRYLNPISRRSTETIARLSMKNRIKMENLSEEMRILYVACTRPKDKLIMIGSVRDFDASCKKWIRPISPLSLSRGQSYLDWIAPVVMRHPDGEAIRLLSPSILETKDLLSDPSKWKVSILRRSSIVQQNREKQVSAIAYQNRLRQFENTKPSEEREEIFRRLNWSYPYHGAEQIPSKLSVSEIKRIRARKVQTPGYYVPDLQKGPRFLRKQEGFSGAETGTIMHLVMQHLDFARVSGDEIQRQVEEMLQRELLTEQEAAIVDIDKIQGFFASYIGQRVLNAAATYREVPFNLLLRADEVFDESECPEEQLLIQGVIDLYFEEGEQLVLVDYKTDHIAVSDDHELRERYEVQISLYKRALETITAKPVKESFLFLFSTGQPLLI